MRFVSVSFYHAQFLYIMFEAIPIDAKPQNTLQSTRSIINHIFCLFFLFLSYLTRVEIFLLGRTRLLGGFCVEPMNF